MSLGKSGTKYCNEVKERTRALLRGLLDSNMQTKSSVTVVSLKTWQSGIGCTDYVGVVGGQVDKGWRRDVKNEQWSRAFSGAFVPFSNRDNNETRKARCRCTLRRVNDAFRRPRGIGGVGGVGGVRGVRRGKEGSARFANTVKLTLSRYRR